MRDLKALAGQLIQNPETVRSLIAQVKDPLALAKSAGITDQQLGLLSGIGCAVSGLLSRVTQPVAKVASSEESVSMPSLPVAPTPGNGNTAVVGVLSLVAVTGAIAVLGTVSAVALSNGSQKKQP